MKRVNVLMAVAILGAVGLMAVLAAPALSGQSGSFEQPQIIRGDLQGFWGGVQIGVSVRDLEDADNQKGGGAYVERVQPDSPAAKAGLLHGDIITRFDGEVVRSVRQLTRLVRETPAGRMVSITAVRDGKTMDMTVTPEPGAPLLPDADSFFSPRDQERLREKLEEARRKIERIPFDLDYDFSIGGSFRVLGPSLGVTVEELTPQLAAFFGAKGGVLVSSVSDDSPASRAALKAGDVIVSVNGRAISSSGGLARELRNAGSNVDVTIAIVRDKKETTVKARLDEIRPRRPGQPIRTVRATPA